MSFRSNLTGGLLAIALSLPGYSQTQFPVKIDVEFDDDLPGTYRLDQIPIKPSNEFRRTKTQYFPIKSNPLLIESNSDEDVWKNEGKKLRERVINNLATIIKFPSSGKNEGVFGYGSAFFFNDEGFFLTAYHVVEEIVNRDYEGYIFLPGKTRKSEAFQTQILAYDSAHDLALGRIEKKLNIPKLSFRNKDLNQGDLLGGVYLVYPSRESNEEYIPMQEISFKPKIKNKSSPIFEFKFKKDKNEKMMREISWKKISHPIYIGYGGIPSKGGYYWRSDWIKPISPKVDAVKHYLTDSTDLENLGPNIHGKKMYLDLMPAVIKVDGGDSGLPLFDREGKVGGIISLREDPYNRGYVVPSESIIQFLKNYCDSN